MAAGRSAIGKTGNVLPFLLILKRIVSIFVYPLVVFALYMGPKIGSSFCILAKSSIAS